jgi:glycosyltransferase involved in cell wall biosynthesis
MSFIPGLTSVIVLTLNSERYITRCLDSLAAQTYKDFEVVLVDAGSNDRTCEITDSYRSHIRIVWVDAPGTNMGQARNIGIRNANGEFLAYCDSDDMFEPGKLEAGVNALRADPQADVTYGAAAHFRAESPEKVYLSRRQVILDDAPAKHLVRAQTININTLLVRRGGGCDVYFQDDSAGRYGEDWQYLINLCTAGARFKFVPGIFSRIEVRSDSHTTWDIQHLMKWHVNRHIAKRRDELLAAGCPPALFAFHMSKHWMKFLLACNAAGHPAMPTALAFNDIGGVPLVVKFYNRFLLPLARSLDLSALIKRLWTLNRRLKELQIVNTRNS